MNRVRSLSYSVHQLCKTADPKTSVIVVDPYLTLIRSHTGKTVNVGVDTGEIIPVLQKLLLDLIFRNLLALELDVDESVLFVDSQEIKLLTDLGDGKGIKPVFKQSCLLPGISKGKELFNKVRDEFHLLIPNLKGLRPF